MDAFTPLLNTLTDGDKPAFAIDQNQNFSFGFTTQDGFQTVVDHKQISVAFVHRIRAKAVSGGLPRMEMLSSARPYTELLEVVFEKLINATLMLPNVRGRSIVRVGVVSITNVAEEEAPPGIQRFIQYVSRPWKNPADSYSINLTTELGSSANSHDRCVHTLVLPEAPDSLLGLSFDWQRIFKAGHAANKGTMEQFAKDASRDALAYFEDLAEGNRFDVGDSAEV